jgi:lycopene cyclase domain-containing protein
MLTQRFAYLFAEIAVLTGLLTFSSPWMDWSKLRTRSFAFRSCGLFILWTVIDLIAVSKNIWSFPKIGTTGLTVLSLPIEEYLVFLIHTLMTFLTSEYLSLFSEKQ